MNTRKSVHAVSSGRPSSAPLPSCTMWRWARACVSCPAASLAAATAVVVALAWQMWPALCCEHLRLEPEREGQALPPLCPDVGRDVVRDIQRYGYSLVPAAIGLETAGKLFQYASKLPFSDYFGRGYRHPEERSIFSTAPELWPIIRDLILKIQAGSSIRVADGDAGISTTWKSLEFLTTDDAAPERSVHFAWHQDFEAFYLAQQTYNYLNMYLVVDKSDPHEAGISIVSMEALRARSPKTYEAILGGSASYWEDHPVGSSPWRLGPEQQVLRSHMAYDKFWIQDFALEALGCTPRLAPGDLLILRGDTPHRTQTPSRGRRTSLSVRVALQNFTTANMLEGGMVKYARLRNSQKAFVGQALRSEYGNEEIERLVKGVKQQSLGFRVRKSALNAQVAFGYHYRVLLSKVRCATGELLGEPACPIAYF